MIPTQRGKRLLTWLAAAMAVIGLGVTNATTQDASPKTMAEDDTLKHQSDEVAVTIGGIQVSVDPETGELQPLSKAEAKALADQMRNMFPPRTIDEANVRSDGSLSAVVVPNVLRLSVARVQSDGKLAVDCADDLEAAIDFMTLPAVENAATTKAEER